MPRDRDLHLAVLASEQLMPNLQSALVLANADRLAAVHIYYTSDEKRSAQPARRLHHLLDTIAGHDDWPGFEIHLPETASGPTPQDVRAFLLERMDARPDARWFLNATGGLKLMSTAFMALCDHARVEHVVYRELGQGWFEITAGEHGPVAQPAQAQLGLEDARLLVERIPLTRLLKAQLAADHLNVQHSDDAPRALAPDIIASYLRDHPRAKYRDAFEQTAERRNDSMPGTNKEGFFYEYLMAALLREWPLAEVLHSLELISSDTSKPAQEIDLAVQYRDRIILIDLKASTAHAAHTPPNEQIRNAAQSRDALGGLSAQAIMLRPNWATDPDRLALAGANRVHLMDADHMPRIFQKLADLLGLEAEPTEGMQALQAFHANCRTRGHAHAAARSGRPLPRTETSGPGIDVDAACDESMRMRGANWYAARFRNEIHLRFGPPDGDAARGDHIARLINSERERARARNRDARFLGGKLTNSGNGAQLHMRNFAKEGIERFMKAIQKWPTQIEWYDEVASLLEPPNNDAPENRSESRRKGRSPYGKRKPPKDEHGPMAEGLGPLKDQLANKPSEDRNQ